MKHLNYELHKLTLKNRDGSYATQIARSKILAQCADELHALGYRKMSAGSLKPKHIEALVKHWSTRELSMGTIKNRLSHVRWWAGKVGKQSVVLKDNAAYGVMNRQYVTNTDKARHLDDRLEKVKDAYTRQSLQLQQAFGLRREEAIKFMPSYADRGDKIVLKESWTKGGKAREIPIRNEDQRAVLQSAHKLAGRGSLIPSDKNYIEQLKVYERNVTRAGFNRMHGLRHAYAQQRYLELTGWKSPVQGGPARQTLDSDRLDRDVAARLEISLELGHERLEIVAVYIGT